MDARMLIAQGIGTIATVIAILAYQCKDTKKLYLMQFFSNLGFTLHYLVLGAATGLLLNGMGTVRLVMLSFIKGKWARSNAAMWILMAVMVLCTVITWNGWLSLLPALAQVLSTPLYFRRNGKLLRYGQLFFMSPCWLIYNIFNYSIPGAVTDLMHMTSVIVSFIRFKGQLGKEEAKGETV